MQSRLNPYLNFNGNAQEAMEFYESVFGGKLELTNYLDGGMSEDADEGKLIMHSQLETDNGIIFMGADVPRGMEYTVGTTVQMCLNGDNEAELTQYFEKLSDGGQVSAPLTKAPWGDTFGMFTDKFDIKWLVNIAVV